MDLKSMFLMEFTKALIFYSNPKNANKKFMLDLQELEKNEINNIIQEETTEEEPEEIEYVEIPKPKEPIKPIRRIRPVPIVPRPVPIKQNPPQKKEPGPEERISLEPRERTGIRRLNSNRTLVREIDESEFEPLNKNLEESHPLEQTQKNQQSPTLPPFYKIKPILQDRSVSAIECQGPDTALIVYKRNMPQRTNITMTKEEIEDLLEEVSEKVRIPLLEGLFKARMQNLSIIATVSENAGSRFVIEKMPPTFMG